MTEESIINTILRTKLHRPPVANDHLHRQHLLDRLNRRLHRPLTLVSAPAGYGKSTLVSCWLETCDIPSAWVSLDDSDNDLRLFLSYLLESVQSIFPGSGKETQTLLKAPDLPLTTELTRTLINEMDLIEKPFILVLDDYHLIKEKKIHDLLIALLKYPPGGMHLVVITRRDPAFPLPELRAHGKLTEVRMKDLRFSAEEVARFLQHVMGIEVEDRIAVVLEEKTEGWVAGLRLAALSMHEGADRDRILENFPDSGRYVMDYLTTEVLEHQSPKIQNYLLSTSILNRFCAPLSEAICNNENNAETCSLIGQQFIDHLEKTNLFVVPLDDEGFWYRYHHLFQRLLQRQMEKRFNPIAIAGLHKQAGDWFVQKGLIDEGFQHFLAAGDIPTVARLVGKYRHDLMNMERWHQLRRWLDLLPRDTVEKNPELLISEAWLLIGWPEMVEVMDRIEALLDKMASKSATFTKLQGEFDTLRSLVFYHTAKGRQSCSLAKQALERLGCEQTSITGLAVMLLSLSYQMLGDLESAQTVVHEAIKEVNVRGSTYDARVLLTFCFMSYMEADLKGVLQSATQCLKLGQEFELGECIAHGDYFLGICHYQRNELALAEKYLLPVVKGPYVVNSHNFAYSAFALALTYQALGKTIETQEILDLVVNYALEIRNTSLLQTAQAFQAELALRQENITETSHWAKVFDPDPFFVAYRFYVPQITHAKWLLAQDTKNGDLQATNFLLRLHDFFVSSHNSSLLIEVQALQALLHEVKGDRPTAIATLEKAVTLAEPGGFIRPFIDLGSKMAALFLRLAEQKPVSEYIENIIKAFRNENIAEQAEPSKDPLTPLPAVSTQPLSEPLTRREIEILVLLAPGLMNKEIASRLFISPETVKKHTQSIYRKLNASNRQQAVARSYELGILPKA